MFKFVELFHNKGTIVYIYNVGESTAVQTPMLQNIVIFVKKKKNIYTWKSEYVHNICTLFCGMELTPPSPKYGQAKNYYGRNCYIHDRCEE